MDILLVRPDPGNERFGLGPFFRVEPLGLGYIAASLRGHDARVHVADLRFRPSLRAWLARARPRVVGISCLHALEYDAVLDVCREVRRHAPEALVVVGGHAAAAYPKALESSVVDVLALGDGEVIFPALVRALRSGSPFDVPDVALRTGDGWVRTPPAGLARDDMNGVPLPERWGLDRYRDGYRCLFHRPVWLVETARGCPFRCNFCSVANLHGRTVRLRAIDHVVDDFAAVGERVFVVDDLFFSHPSRSLELARALARRGVRKRWILVQSRGDVVARHPEVVRAWKALTDVLDVFIGFEAPTDAGLTGIEKDSTVARTLEGVAALRAEGCGVTGNFVVDPEWREDDFEALWSFVAEHKLRRAGYTILTPLPGTPYYESLEHRVRGQPWAKYDMHHLLWEPRLGKHRFLELFAETWRRSVLNLQGDKRLVDWVGSTKARDLPALLHMLVRSQRMMRTSAYLAENA